MSFCDHLCSAIAEMLASPEFIGVVCLCTVDYKTYTLKNAIEFDCKRLKVTKIAILQFPSVHACLISFLVEALLVWCLSGECGISLG